MCHVFLHTHNGPQNSVYFQFYHCFYTLWCFAALLSYFRHQLTFKKYLGVMQHNIFLTLLWKCGSANGDVLVFKTPASPVDKPVNAAQKWWAIRNQMWSRHWTGRELGPLAILGNKPRINQELWMTATSGWANVLCCVQGVWRRAARRGRGSSFQKWEMCRALMSRGWTKTSVECPDMSLNHIWRFVPNPLKLLWNL